MAINHAGEEPLRSYEEVNGAVPKIALFDSNGLAQQTSGLAEALDGMDASTAVSEARTLGAANDAEELVPKQRMLEADDALLFDPKFMSNVCPDMADFPGFAAAAAKGAAERLAQGFSADGSPGGAFSESAPPPGLRFGGYLKGYSGIVWKPSGPSATVLNHVMFEILPGGDADGMRALLESGAISPNQRVGKGPTAQRTLLHWAVARGQRLLAELLIERGANVDLTDGHGQKPADLFTSSESMPSLPF